MRFVFFDIDGTLLATHGAGRRAMETALAEHFGTAGPADYRYDGKTDRQIARDLMRAAGYDDDVIDARMPAVLARYIDVLRAELASAEGRVEVHVGILELLAALEARRDAVLGLLTGNIEPGAHAKLSAAQLAPRRFRVGAFGSDHERREALPAIARARASALLGCEVPGDSIVIVGDTPSDITCGRGIGARAIGVATGSYTADALEVHCPAAVFTDLRDTSLVVRAIFDA